MKVVVRLTKQDVKDILESDDPEYPQEGIATKLYNAVKEQAAGSEKEEVTTMDAETLKHLRDLSIRATDIGHVTEYGSANIVIYNAEFHALEEAIRELSRRADQ